MHLETGDPRRLWSNKDFCALEMPLAGLGLLLGSLLLFCKNSLPDAEASRRNLACIGIFLDDPESKDCCLVFRHFELLVKWNELGIELVEELAIELAKLGVGVGQFEKQGGDSSGTGGLVGDIPRTGFESGSVAA